MSKAALNAAGVSLAHDLKGDGMGVAILHPGLSRVARKFFVQTTAPFRSGKCSQKYGFRNSREVCR